MDGDTATRVCQALARTAVAGYTCAPMGMYLRCVAVVGVAISVAAGCRWTPPETPAPCLTIATGAFDDVSYVFGAALAGLFSERGVGLCMTSDATDGSTFNVKALEDGTADFALARADTTYTAYVEGTALRAQPHTSLRGVAIVYGSALHVVVRADAPVRQWTELRNRQVGFSIFSSTDLLPIVGYRGLVAAAGDLGPTSIEGVRMRSKELTHALATGRIDSGFVLTAYPVPFLHELARTADIRLLDIGPRAAARIRARYPFFKPAVIPPGTYPGQPDPVSTVVVENLLVTRDSVAEEVVYRVTRTLLESLSVLAHDHAAALQVNPDLAPATPIPLHPGAARYYRERELLQ